MNPNKRFKKAYDDFTLVKYKKDYDDDDDDDDDEDCDDDDIKSCKDRGNRISGGYILETKSHEATHYHLTRRVRHYLDIVFGTIQCTLNNCDSQQKSIVSVIPDVVVEILKYNN